MHRPVGGEQDEDDQRENPRKRTTARSDERDEEEDRKPRKKAKAKAGSNSGLIIGLAAGAVGLIVLGVVVGVVVYFVTREKPNLPGAVAKDLAAAPGGQPRTKVNVAELYGDQGGQEVAAADPAQLPAQSCGHAATTRSSCSATRERDKPKAGVRRGRLRS